MAENKHRIATWLQENPTKTNDKGVKVRTTQKDAKAALDIPKEEQYKIKGGNLSKHRDKLRLEPGSTKASNALRKADQIQTTPDKKVRRGAHIKRGVLNAKGLVGDHIYTNSLLAKGERFTAERFGISVEAANLRMRNAWESTGEGYGHSAKNIQGLTARQNQRKELQERILHTKYYQHLENKPSMWDPEGQAEWESRRLDLSEQLENVNGNDNGKNGKVNGQTNGGKHKWIKPTALVTTAVTSAALLPSDAGAREINTKVEEGEYLDAAVAYGKDLVVGEAKSRTALKGFQLAQKSLIKQGFKKAIIRQTLKLAGKSLVKKGVAIAAGPFAPIVLAGLILHDAYEIADIITDGKVKEFTKTKAISTSNRKRYRGGQKKQSKETPTNNNSTLSEAI
jgi:hypothetical protein